MKLEKAFNHLLFSSRPIQTRPEVDKEEDGEVPADEKEDGEIPEPKSSPQAAPVEEPEIELARRLPLKES